jgi:hypothetical protein
MVDALFDFESEDSFGYVDDSERIRREKADLIAETIGTARDLIDIDLLPKIKQSDVFADLERFMIGFKHMNLYKHGWRIQFGTSKEWAGLCSSADKEKHGDHAGVSKNRNIYISIDFVKHDENWKENMVDVIYHEMAHAVVSEVFYFTGRSSVLDSIDPSNRPSEGHGLVWENLCIAINDTPPEKGSVSESNLFDKHNAKRPVCARFYANANMSDSIKNYKYRCFNCSHVGYGSTNNFTERCSNCGKSVIVERN